jgi:acyl-CoA thioesterase-2
MERRATFGQHGGVGDLGRDTEVEELGGGRFRATLSPEWEIWGPMGGYVAACALRAAGRASGHPEPASFSCHYLGVARFEPVDITVEARREGRAASSHRVEVTQQGRKILDALVWSTTEGPGLEHDETVAPDVPGPDELPAPPSDMVRPFPFWGNLDQRIVQVEPVWPPSEPRPAVWREWLRFVPTATFADPWTDAARLLVLVDLPSWPSAHRPHAWRQHGFIAPTLDLNVAFHQSAASDDWLLCDGSAPLSVRGLFGWTARIWSTDARLLASGGGQCLYRPPPTGGNPGR